MAQPGKGTLHHPSARQQDKPFVSRVALDNLQVEPTMLLHPLDECTSVDAIRPQLFQARKQSQDHHQQQLGAIPILAVAFRDHDFEDQAEGIDQQMPFAPVYLFATVIAANAPFSVVFTDWLSRIAALGVGSRPSCWRSVRANI
jgi:hypothetical protein